MFRASFFLGLLPLLYAPLLPLPLLVLAAAFCFRRTLREVFVSLCSVVLPFLAVCYIAWGQGANPLDTPAGLWHSFVSDSGYRIFANTHPLVPAILGIVLFIVLCAVFFGLISFRAISIKARGMLTYTILLFTVTGSLMAVPSVTPGLLAGVPRDAKVSCREVFGPVTIVAPYRDWPEALATVNDSDFGLQAGVFTHDVHRIHQAYNIKNGR